MVHKQNLNEKPRKPLSIALVSDFFFPNKGGIETHIRTIGEELHSLGHKVIVITHKYNGYIGIRKIGNLTVYYLDLPIMGMNSTFPTIFANYAIFREIFNKNRIEIVHGHQSLSNMCLEGIYHATHMNIKTVMTDHSMFEIAKLERILVNRIARFVCKNIDHVVCVSQISKENTCLRIGIRPEKISVIPNGIIPGRFYPIKKQERSKIRILVVSRLAFRKGIDLLVDALPLICRNECFEVVIVGNGPKKSDLWQAIDENYLHDQVRILDEINYEDVPNVLRSGDIFLNTSLTEAFCLGVLEAASCGLLVVSTNVGGIHEILGDDGILYCRPTAEDIALQLEEAARIIKEDRHDPFCRYQAISKKYSWSTIAKQTEELYYRIPPKNINFKKTVSQFPGMFGFISRFGTFIEYAQIKLFDIFKPFKQ